MVDVTTNPDTATIPVSPNVVLHPAITARGTSRIEAMVDELIPAFAVQVEAILPRLAAADHEIIAAFAHARALAVHVACLTNATGETLAATEARIFSAYRDEIPHVQTFLRGEWGAQSGEKISTLRSAVTKAKRQQRKPHR